MIHIDAKLDKDEKFPDELPLEELNTRYQDCLTVGRLRKILDKYPDDAKVLIERVEDSYYTPKNWAVVYKESMGSQSQRDFNQEIINGTLSENFPGLDTSKYRVSTEAEIKGFLTQYHPAWGVAGYKDDPNNLYIDLHY